ncbi:TM2 domain-containing protein [Candidatus Saccharibacteria bacterium]|nr:TM2 domain-containing protein [Candidatus Saccharibacteria bacterium]
MNTKSATTAGLLGIFLGSVGAHNWYLGEKKKGIIHICLFASGIIVEILATIILPMALSLSSLLAMAGVLSILASLAGLAMAGNGIWGLVEGITLLSQGDEGLARKGYPVAQPQQAYQQPPYQQPYQPYPPQQPYAQPYPPQQSYQQPPVQPAQPVAPAPAPEQQPAPAPEAQPTNEEQNGQQ